MSTTYVVLQQTGVQNVINTLVQFLPRLLWALVVLGLGVGVAIFVSRRAADAVEGSTLLADWLAGYVASGVKLLLYFFAVTVALSELRVDVGVLVVFLDGIAFGLGAGLALAVGVALGWGSKDYVADHLEEWVDAVTADEVPAAADADGAATGDGGAGAQTGGADESAASDEESADGGEDASDEGDDT